jgi:spore maturation protein A
VEEYMKKLWFGLIFLGLLFSFINQKPETVTNVLFFDIEKSVELILNLIPIMAFWTGLMRIVEKTNILNKLSSVLKPVIRYLFKDVQNDVNAVNAILMTLAANLFGIGNSATAFGIKAMQEMQKSNLRKNTASKAMCMFLIINVSSIQLIPLNIIKLRADSGSVSPSEIMVPTLIVTAFSTMVAVISGKYFERKEL